MMDTAQLVALAAGLGWASGLRLYAAVFITGLAGHLGWIALPHDLLMLQGWPMLIASAAMLVVEFFADKIPLLDSLWDSVHTLIRIPAGAALAAGVFGWDNTTAATIAALLGGGLAATAHAAKASTRAAINTSPEPFSNIAASLAGDAAVPTALWLSWTHPWLFFVALALTLFVMVCAIYLLAKFVRTLWQRRRRMQPASV